MISLHHDQIDMIAEVLMVTTSIPMLTPAEVGTSTDAGIWILRLAAKGPLLAKEGRQGSQLCRRTVSCVEGLWSE